MKPLKSWKLMLTVFVAFGSACSDDDGDKINNPPTIDETALVTAIGDAYFTSYATPSGAPVVVGAAEVWANLSDGNAANDPVILDWRSAPHFALGHIQGAQNVLLADFDDVLASIPVGKAVVNVCYTGQSASHVTAYMNMLGINAQNLKFGMCGWTADRDVNLGKWEDAVTDQYATWLVTTASTPTTEYALPELATGKSTGKEILRTRALSYLAGGLKSIGVQTLYQDIEINGNDEDYYIVNYFPTGEYSAGHIPGAVRYEPKQDFRSTQLLKYLPTDKKIVVYCWTGQTSAQVVAYLNALGYDAYSLLFGVNGMCYSNGQICTSKFTVPTTSYPVVQ